LELEITESVLMADPVASNRVFNELRELGVRLALDDFGTGYSSLSYLRSFPFNKIKIDRSFVREIATNPGALAIVQTIVSLGASLRIPVCAEGIETEGQYEAARALGCSQVQGYLFGRPERAVEALLTLRNAQKRVA
jgi:EAL domain-containing protein (putative c-di-GMP-specific phosphodiesterase class I)